MKQLNKCDKFEKYISIVHICRAIDTGTMSSLKTPQTNKTI